MGKALALQKGERVTKGKKILAAVLASCALMAGCSGGKEMEDNAKIQLNARAGGR